LSSIPLALKTYRWDREEKKKTSINYFGKEASTILVYNLINPGGPALGYFQR
jgi:hypothetical protein